MLADIIILADRCDDPVRLSTCLVRPLQGYSMSFEADQSVVQRESAAVVASAPASYAPRNVYDDASEDSIADEVHLPTPQHMCMQVLAIIITYFRGLSAHLV